MRLITQLFILVLIVFLNTKCVGNKELDELNQKADDINKRYYGSFIRLDTINYKPLVAGQKFDLNQNAVLVFFDADCSVCIQSLATWRKQIPLYKMVDENIQFVFILETTNNLILSANLNAISFPQHMVWLDKNHLFTKNYEFSREAAFNTFMLKNGQIKLIASPLISENIKRKYFQLIGHRSEI